MSKTAFRNKAFLSISICPHLAIAWCWLIICLFIEESIAHRTESSTTIDGAEHRTAIDVHGDSSGNITSSIGITTESTATAKHVAIDVTGAPSTNRRTARCRGGLSTLTGRRLRANGHRHVAQHVTILTTAKHRTKDPAASNIHHDILHIRVFVEEYALITLTCAEEVASDWVSVNLGQRARHTHRAAIHRDRRCAIHIGGLVTTIDVGQNMAAINGHICITFNPSSTHNVSTSALIGIEIRHTA